MSAAVHEGQKRVCVSVLIRVSLLCRDNMAMATLIKESIQLGPAYSFRGSVCYHRGGKHGSLQAVMELERRLRVLSLLISRQQRSLFHRTGVERV